MEVILVTGANRGIGLALTRVLLASQNIVIAGCRKPDQATELSQLALSYPETLDLIQCDLYSENQLAAAAEASLKRRQKVDVIVNNAAILPEAGKESILNIDLDLLGRAFNNQCAGNRAGYSGLLSTLCPKRAAAYRQFFFRPRFDFDQGGTRPLCLFGVSRRRFTQKVTRETKVSEPLFQLPGESMPKSPEDETATGTDTDTA